MTPATIVSFLFLALAVVSVFTWLWEVIRD